MKTNSPQKQYEPNLSIILSAGDTYEWSKVLLARAHPDGTLELLTGEWALALGFGRDELKRKTLEELLGSDARASAAMKSILGPDEGPVDVTFRCRDGSAKGFRLHRRYDEFGSMVFIVGEEMAVDSNA